MKYTYESQKKALKYLIENAPHDMEKFQSLYNVEVEEEEDRAEISLHNILFSDVWTVEEKIQLIKLYGHNDEKKNEYRDWTYKTYEEDIGSSVGIEGLPLIDQCIKEKNFSGVQALLKLGNHISVATIKRIIEYIDDPSERYKFCELLVSYYKDKENIKAYIGNGIQCYLIEIPTLCDRYPLYSEHIWDRKELWRTVSSMEDICATNDLELVKLFLPTVKNIRPLFMFAVKTKNIEMVKLFIEAGADVNFQDLEFENDNNRRLFKIPLKIAIDNNDLEMVKFLHQNGADLDFVDKSERMQEFIGNLGKEESEKETHQYKDYWDRHDYIIWTKAPLEYAITLGAASIIDQDLINNNSTRKNDSFEKQFKDRMEIVKYLYENGATFGEGEINYTDLICFAIKSDDFETTKYFFDEALKNNNHLDFIKIINFIHIPGYIHTINGWNNGLQYYKYFEEGASTWFKMCEEYSKKMDKENHNRNVKLMLEKIFKDFAFEFDKYREIITDFSKALPRETLKEIPAVFGVDFENLEEVLSLGYDINCINTDGSSILMHYIRRKHISVETIDKLISLGANPNYQSPDGKSALSCAIAKLPEYDFEKFFDNFNRYSGELYYAPETYEIDSKNLVKAIIKLSNRKIIKSKTVKKQVCESIKPGFPQIIYNDLLKALVEKGFKVDDDYVKESILFLNKSHYKEYITNPWEYLWNLYSNFANQPIGTNLSFPRIEDTKKIKYAKKESNDLFTLIAEHLKRNFVTSIEQISKPDKVVDEEYYYDAVKEELEDRTALQLAQDELLGEISKYIGNLDYRQIMSLINNCSIIDTKAIIRADLLPTAMNIGDKKLCKKLIEKGATIVLYDKNGHDVTSERYSKKEINLFQSLNEEYDPNQECNDLLAEIGCGNKVLSKRKRLVKESTN